MSVTYSGEVTEKANGRIVIRPGAGDRSGVERIEIHAADGAGHTSLPEMGDVVSVTLEVTTSVAAAQETAAPKPAAASASIAPAVASVTAPTMPAIERRSPPLP